MERKTSFSLLFLATILSLIFLLVGGLTPTATPFSAGGWFGLYIWIIISPILIAIGVDIIIIVISIIIILIFNYLDKR